ncbi:MAG: hypothetical protein KME27_05315 [Lyngbya sp. HA4199-MV5]|jgi:hypothetical protein|nr:hypothetical protein [Lyngbya sp. HA4199-MV5]
MYRKAPLDSIDKSGQEAGGRRQEKFLVFGCWLLAKGRRQKAEGRRQGSF